MHLDVSYNGFDDFSNGMRKIAAGIPGGIYSAVVKACSLIEIRAKTHHLAGHTLKARTHRLQHSVKSLVYHFSNTVIGRVGSPVVYAAIHEYGGIIRRKNAKYLVFRIEGKFVRTKKVTMPARRWLSKSVEDVKPQIERIFGREVELVIE